MWYLKSSNGRMFYMRRDKIEVFIGRSGEVCDLTLLGDSSVSRRHAALRLENDQVSLQDLGSKYGTFINNNIEKKIPIGPNNTAYLNPNDRFRIGTLENTWNLHKISLITCTSTMKGENVEEMKKDLEFIGVSIQSEWDESCTHLTMPAITLTVKVLAALAFGRHIVTAEFWKAWRKVLSDSGNPPSPTDYLPQVIESTLNKETVSFTPDDRRKTIFAGTKFIFFSRTQMNFYKMILECCGASVAHLRDCKLKISNLCADNVVVVQFSGSIPLGQETQSQQQSVSDIINYITKNSRRVIPDIEIGLAILLVSTEKYCNPKKNLLLFNQHSTNPDKNENTKILAPETQEMDLNKKDQSGVVIEESLVSLENVNESINTTLQQTVKRKRKLQDTDEPISLENIQKRTALSGVSLSRTEDEHMFDFVQEAPTATNACSTFPGTGLNFMKPKNRQHANSEDNIFNFVPDNNEQPTSSGVTTHQFSLFTSSSKRKPSNRDLSGSTSEVNSCQFSVLTAVVTKRKQHDAELPHPKKPYILMPEPSKMCDVKTDILELLKKSFWKSCADEIAKQEIIKTEMEEINDSKSNFGDTIVSICNNLVVKTETSKLFCSSSYSGANFKKFRKILPLCMQVTVIPSSSMSIYRPEAAGEQAVEVHSDDEDERIWMQQNKKKGRRYVHGKFEF